MAQITVSIVCYNTPFEIISKCIDSVEMQKVSWKGVFIDHSPDQKYEKLFSNRTKWKYIYRGDINDGFGGGNNFAFQFAKDSEFFLILNPDLYIKSDTFQLCLESAEDISNLGLLGPKVFFPNGNLQRLNKMDPSVFALLGRRFPLFAKLAFVKAAIERYEMVEFQYQQRQEIEFLSGCFLFIPTAVYERLNGFDSDFFLYFEDADLCRRCRGLGYKVFFEPRIEVTHEYQRGSHRSLKLFFIFLRSMLHYFNKWGYKWY
ncbi:glycosyltransferase [Leptospira ryugenii]|uniref:glycosyltransferase n=1 Tax=Leptospira ryugenii TaxID=1917863 RepID=UPI001FCEE6E0|nr:glycosyltransferase family 2 protein [Leptospira ryugenii]